MVAPHAGAWIETKKLNSVINPSYESRPTRARGLKLVYTPTPTPHCHVAPHAGAWIETILASCVASLSCCRAPRGRVD